jgi:hypothetical protein
MREFIIVYEVGGLLGLFSSDMDRRLDKVISLLYKRRMSLIDSDFYPIPYKRPLVLPSLLLLLTSLILTSMRRFPLCLSLV